MLEGESPRQGQPPTGWQKKEKPDVCPAFLVDAVGRSPSAKGPAHHRMVHGPSILCAEHARPLRGPCSSGPLVHRSGSTG